MTNVDTVIPSETLPLNLLRIEFLLNSLCKISPYLTGNTLRLRYKPNRLMLFGETVAIHCKNHTEHKYTLWAECRILVC
jgi:hypothetical protein